MPRLLKRALLLYLAFLGLSAATIGALLWHHIRTAAPCPPEALVGGEPVACSFHLQLLADRASVMGALVVAFGACLLLSWLSFRRDAR